MALAREYHCLPVAIVFNLPEQLCQERNRQRPERAFGAHVVRHQSQQLRRSLRHLEREGFSHVFVLSSPAEVEAAVVQRQPIWSNRKHEHGPFDIIGDVHGCCDELHSCNTLAMRSPHCQMPRRALATAYTMLPAARPFSWGISWIVGPTRPGCCAW